MLKKIIVGALLCTVSLNTGFSVLAEEVQPKPISEPTQKMSESVLIPDVILKGYLNSLLKQSSDAEITREQLATIKSVNLSSTTITDLTGLEYATNLETFILQNTQVTDLTPIVGLTNLSYMTLSGGNVTNELIPDLHQLVKLQSLSITSTLVDNTIFQKFNHLPVLRYFYLQNNMRITDISALASLPLLDTLFVQFDGINDFQSISRFPSLKNLAAFGQNTGRQDPHQSISSTALTFNEETQTLFIPFTIMTNRLTSFDGFQAPFSMSTSSSNTYLEFNGTQVDNSRLAIDSMGITVNGVDRAAFDDLNELHYNARYDNPTGSYPTPPGMSYVISSGTYFQYFDIRHSIQLTADPTYSYLENEAVDEAQFLTDVHAKTDDNSPITSNFATVVDFSKPGNYLVTLNAKNAAGLVAPSVTVDVTVLPKPIITAEPTITYDQYTEKTEADFLSEIAGKTSDGSPVTSDFLSAVDFGKVGEYEVQLNAVNERGQKADPVTVKVRVQPTEEAIVPPLPLPIDPENPVPPTVEPNPNPKPTVSDKIENQPFKENQKISKGKSVTTKMNEAKKFPQTGEAKQMKIGFVALVLLVTSLVILKRPTKVKQ